MSGIPDGFVSWDDTYDPCDQPDYSRQHMAHDWFMAAADHAAISWNVAMNQAVRLNRQFSLWFPKGDMQ